MSLTSVNGTRRTAASKGKRVCAIAYTEYIYDQLGNVIAVNRKGEANYKLNYDNFGLLKSMKTEMLDEFENFLMTDEYLYTFWE